MVAWKETENGRGGGKERHRLYADGGEPVARIEIGERPGICLLLSRKNHSINPAVYRNVRRTF
jgi:hypothetical protein